MGLDPAAVEKVLVHIKRRADYEHFFETISSPEWITALSARGFFADPPEPARSEQGISFPRWPESQCLKRLAAIAPTVVRDAILRVPDTENAWVHEDFVDAALGMPPGHAAAISAREREWLRSQPYLYALLPKKYGSLITYLATGGETDEAIELLKVLLQVRVPSEAAEQLFAIRDAAALMGDWDYRALLDKPLAALIDAEPAGTIAMLLAVLTDAVRSYLGDAGAVREDDYSTGWVPDLTASIRHEHGARKCLALSAARVVRKVVSGSGSYARSLIAQLETEPLLIHRRIALHALSAAARPEVDLVEERIVTRALFGDVLVRNEYDALSAAFFAQLSAGARDTVLSWIATADAPAAYIEWYKGRAGHAPGEEQLQRWKEEQQRDRLAPIRLALPAEWAARFDDIVERVGPPGDQKASRASFGTWRPTSPLSTEAVRGMIIREVARYTAEWDAGDPDRRSFDAPSPEGLADTISADVRERPLDYSAEALAFSGVHPFYIAKLLGAFRDIVRKNGAIDWHGIIPFLDQVRERFASDPETRAENTVPTTVWLRREIANLLDEGLRATSNGIPTSLRREVWRLLQGLLRDPDPTAADDVRALANMGPFNAGLNTTRGVALLGVLQYCVWVRRNAGTLDDNVSLTLDLPEVMEALNARVDGAAEKALAVHAVLGRQFPLLRYLDSGWAEAHKSTIFPSDPSRLDRWASAWSAYVVYGELYLDVFKDLSAQYALAITRLNAMPEWYTRDDYARQLVDHVMVGEWYGIAGEGDDGLTGRLFAAASAAQRGDAIEVVGRSLGASENPPDPAVISRLEALWERRLSRARESTDPASFRMEMVNFGWWFVSDWLDPAWKLQNLIAALRLSGEVEPDYTVVEKLAELAHDFPEEVVEAVELLLLGTSAHMPYLANRESVERIARAVHTGAPKSVQERFIRLVNLLGARGLRDARRLMPDH